MRKRIILAALALGGIISTGFLSTGSESHAQEATSGRQIVAAPIESVEVVPNGSAPTGHALKVTAALPNGCAEPYDAGHYRFGDFIVAYVMNTEPASDDVICTMEYRTYETTIDLGNDFVPGREYTAYVNGTPITFIAHGGIVPPVEYVEAPIESVNITSTASLPPYYAAQIVAGLPNGCAQPGSYDVTRTGNAISIKVTNTMPAGNPPCTDIYRTYPLSVDLGSEFVPGETYTVDVNGVVTTFTAH